MSEKQAIVVSPTQLISQAIEKGLDIDAMEKLMGLQERWEKKQAEKAFARAMCEFQSEKPEIVKTNGVSHDQGKTFKYFFAPLSDIQSKVDPVLSKHGLSYSFKQENVETGIKITCVVSHVDGHKEESFLIGNPDSSGGKNNIQSVGSSVSYLKRYTLKNALGLSEFDDDGVSSQMSRDELNELALKRLKVLRDEVKVDDKTKARIDEIINNKETSSYTKAIKILEAK